jgi:hypothetical protein
METSKMTIHRALRELKMIDARIQKAIDEFEVAGAKQSGQLLTSTMSVEKFISDTIGAKQSIDDLIERKYKIKKAIVNANATTTVVIGLNTMTIADAINYKYVIDLKKSLFNRIERKYVQTESKVISENEKIKDIALQNAKIMLGKQSDSKVQPTDTDVKQIMDPYYERNKVEIVDPINAKEEMVKLRESIEIFESEVDAVLSEANAITIIEI